MAMKSGLLAIAAAAWLVVAPPGAVTTSAAAEQMVKIAFAGDSLVDSYWAGVTRAVAANACLKNNIEIGRYARNATGLTRGDLVYWPRQVRHIAEAFKPTVLILSIGLNDRQFIVDGAGHRTAWGAPNWTDKYRAEIDEFLRGASYSKHAVLMIGLPSMRGSEADADAKVKNAQFAEAIGKLDNDKVQFVEPWRLDPYAANEVFVSYGRDQNGRMVQIRTPDGTHFTPAGEDLAAVYLLPKIVTAAEREGAHLAQCFNVHAEAK